MRILLILTLSVVSLASAEDTYITMPNAHWTLKLDTPPMSFSELWKKGQLARYIALSIETGVNLNVFAETEGAGSHKECFKTFWPRTQDNPYIVKVTIKTRKDRAAYYGTYLAEGHYQGRAFKLVNGHAYFVKNGHCIDLHVTHGPFTDESEGIINDILRSIKIIE